MVQIRSAQAQDVERIAALMLQLGYEVDAVALRSRLRNRNDRREVLVAVLANDVVGWAAVSIDEPFVEGRCAHLEGLVVDESARSRGIGQQLLFAAEAWARERSVHEMRVLSNVVREPAHAFYHRHEYSTVKKQYNLRKPL